MTHPELQSYLQTQLTQSHQRLKGLTSDEQDTPLFKRSVFSTLHGYATDFLSHQVEPRIIVMPGLRGTGKTTLLGQLFLSLPNENITKIYLSVEEAIKRFDVNLWDIIENYEILMGHHIEQLNEPLIFFFDEIHYDENWSIFLKTLYDKSKNIMVFCTGSSALLLREKINADVARRVFFVDINPICFSEYMLLKNKKPLLEKTHDFIKDAIFHSKNSKEVFEKLHLQRNTINKYWIDIDKFSIQHYIMFGTFPFTLKLINEVLSLNFISQIINKVIYTDIPQFYPFEITTLNNIDKLLYLLADTLGVSLTKLSETLSVKPDTLRLILKSLENAGLILRIPPDGAHFKQVKKASKYLFSTPALRLSYLSSRESTRALINYQGNLLEDIVGMYLNAIFPAFHGFSLTYDVSAGGADFILSFKNQKIVMEVGFGKKDYAQALKTAKTVNPKYSVIISENELKHSEENNTVRIPLKYFLLIKF